MANNLPDNFCILPWIHFYVKQNGSTRLCCISNENIGEYNLKFNNISEVWNSPEMQEKRRAFLNGEQLPECSSCWHNEGMGKPSKRQREMQFYDHALKDIERTSGFTEVVSNSPIYFDLRFGNLCNLKCRMCGSWASTQWEKELKYIKANENDVNLLEVTSDHGKTDLKNMDWFHNEDFWTDLHKLAPYLEEVYFTGGEPTLIPENTELLEHLKEHNTSLKLRFNTNLTNVQDRWIETLNNFKNVHIAASIDGTKGINDLIRFPSKWKAVEKNFDKIASQGDNIALAVVATISVYNVPEIPKLWHWIKHKEEQFGKPIWLTLNGVFHPECLDPRLLPEKIKRPIAKEILNNFSATGKQRQELNGLAHVLLTDFPYDQEKYIQRLRNHITLFDKTRGNKTLEVAPWLHTLINK